MPSTGKISTGVYKIGQDSALSGVSTANIRFYEKENLLSPGGRGDKSYRFYSDADVHHLRFIRACRALNMSLEEVRPLLGLDLTSRPTAPWRGWRWTGTLAMFGRGLQN